MERSKTIPKAIMITYMKDPKEPGKKLIGGFSQYTKIKSLAIYTSNEQS